MMLSHCYINKCCNNYDKKYGPFINSYEAFTECGVKIVFKLFKGGIKGCLTVPKNLKNIIAITINSNKNDYPGPILFWLATSKEWECGDKQNTDYSNGPYCTNNECTLNAPWGTPSVDCVIGKKTYFSYPFKSKYCSYDENFYKNFVKNGIVIYGKTQKKCCLNQYSLCCSSYNDLNIIDKTQFCYIVLD